MAEAFRVVVYKFTEGSRREPSVFAEEALERGLNEWWAQGWRAQHVVVGGERGSEYTVIYVPK